MRWNLRGAAAAAISGTILFAALPAAAENGVTPTAIRIGSHGPLTGPGSFLGLGSRSGMQLAVQEINDAGGINGRKLEVIYEDDANSPAKALAAVKKLIEQDEVFMIFGLSGSNPTVGTLDYIKQLKVPNYFSIASAPKVTRPFNRYLFRGAVTESARYGEVYSEFLAEFLNVKRISILSGSDENAKNEGDNTTRFLEQWYGIKPLMRAEFKIGDKDFTPQLLQVKSSDPELILVAGQTPEASIIVRQARELGVKQPIFVGAASVDNALVANVGLNAEGVIGAWPLPLFPDSNHPDMVKFREAWAKLNPNAPKGRPNLFDLDAYGDTYVLAEAIRRAGPDLTREKVAGALENLDGYRVSEVATPRTFTNYHHIGNFRLRMLVVLGQHWVPLGWEPRRESEILKEFPKPQ
jgi:branched-chain amino acid transport system substrate-binding protein